MTTSGQDRGHFVIAILCIEETRIPVRVFDLTRLAARLEGASLPEAGTEVSLKRGKLEAVGMITRSVQTGVGLAFRWPIDPALWLKLSDTQVDNDRLVVAFQQLPDNLQRRAPKEVTSSLATAAEELRHLRAEVERLGDSLSKDIILVATHPEIQFLDEAMQRLEKIAEALLRLGTAD